MFSECVQLSCACAWFTVIDNEGKGEGRNKGEKGKKKGKGRQGKERKGIELRNYLQRGEKKKKERKLFPVLVFWA